MRQVDAEGDSRGVRGRKKAESRFRSRLRRTAIEWLENRQLLSTSTSTLPSPTVLSSPVLTPNQQVQDVSLATASQALTGAPSASTPSVSVDPLNPMRMVATWVDQDPAGYDVPGFTAPITSYIEGAYSTNGGQTWSPLSQAAFGNINYYGETVNIQQDFSVTPSDNFPNFTQTTDATVGFDRNENFYILSSTHDDSNAAGVLNLQRFSWPESSAAPTFNGTTPVYSWDTPDSGASADQAITPVLAVDTNLTSFTDPATNATVTDPYSGDIYAVWAEIDSNTAPGQIPGFNPDTIRMAASADGGLDFTHAAYVDNSSNANGFYASSSTVPPGSGIPHDSTAHYAEPSVSISQGNGTTVPGGQVTIVYDDYGTIAPLDRILDQQVQDGGTSDQFAFSNPNGTIPAGTIPSGTDAEPGIIAVQIPVSLPSNFTLQALDTTLKIQFPAISSLGAELIPPAAAQAVIEAETGDTAILLFDGDIGSDTPGYTDGTANLGYTSGTNGGAGSGTVFDQEAVRTIEDGTATGHAVGHYQPDGQSDLLALQGLSGSILSGTWTFELAFNPADTSTTNDDFINDVNLNFSQGNDPGYHPGNAAGDQLLPESIIAGMNSLYEVAIPNINPTDSSTSYGVVFHTDNTASPFYDGVAGTNVSGAGGTTAPTQAAAILPEPVIASDNTLGSFSSYQGRLYVAFTGKFTGAQAGDTDIFLAYSTDGGQTWSTLQQVNDDNAATDGFSGASDDAVGNNGITGRAQYQPQVAVDNTTGDVVVSFLDARNDPSDARVATYIAVSADGATLPSSTASKSSGFAADVYANPSDIATNAVTGGAVNLGPIPDNQSAAGGVQSTDGYGTRQALVVTNGRIIPFWASNQNMNVKMAIVDSIMSLAAGPRIISSTQGPVGGSGDAINTTKAADGTALANTIEITFDRAIDPTSYAALLSDTSVYYESPAGGAKVSLTVTAVTPLNGGGNQGATEFSIAFNPASLADTTYGYVGTYSYVIVPTGIVGQDRTVSAPTLTAAVNESAGVFDYTTTVPVGPGATNMPPATSAKSSVTVTGLAGQFLLANPTGAALVDAPYPTGNVAGTFTGTITLIEPTATPPGVASDYTVTLLTPNGQTVTLPSGSATFVVNGNGTTTTTVTYNAAEFTVPASNTVPANGIYTLQVAAQAGETITINAGWQLALNTDIFGLTVPGGAGGSVGYNVAPPTTVTSAVTVTGLAGQFLNANAGTFTGTITLTEPSSTPPAAASDYTVTLLAPNGTTVITITGGTATFVVNGDGSTTTTVTFNSAPFTVPASGTVPAKGTYTLEVSSTDQPPNHAPEEITISKGWRLHLNTATVSGFASPTGSAATSAPVTPYATSSVTITGHAGQYLIANPTDANPVNAAYPTGNVAGTFTGIITLIEPTATPPAAASDYLVTLTTPNGLVITLTGGVATFVVNPNGTTTTTIKFNADQFTVPVSTSVPVNGTYTLKVVTGSQLNEAIEINSGWELTLNSVLVTTTTSRGSGMDQNADGTSGVVPGDDYVVGQPAGFTAYASGTLPLIVSGPHITSTVAVNSAGTVISSGTNNLVLNNTVNSLQVTWDRNIQVSSFTPSQILSIFGPAGAVDLTGLTIIPVSVYTATGQVAYTSGAVADVFDVTFATQQLSGTYTLTIGTGVYALSPAVNLTSGSLTATITAGVLPGLNPPTPNVNNFVITLTTTGGQSIPIPLSEGVITNATLPNGTVYPATVTFTLANLAGILANTPFHGTYTLTVSDSTDKETISISTLQLVLNNSNPLVGPGVSNAMGIASSAIATPILGVDANLNAGLDSLEGAATNGVTTPVTFTATSPAVPATIVPETVNSNGTMPSILMSPIVVPIDFPIQGDDVATGVSGITLTLNITYPTDPDLVAYLLSPDGTQIRLFTNVGAGTNTANFSTTTFSDTASTLASKAGAPFFGTFLPQEPFATLNTDGENSLGTWNLVIENEGNNSGTLNSWSLKFQQPTSGTGLAEFPDDETHTSFQIFNLAASNSLANSTWTAVGPAGITPTTNGEATFSGIASSVVVDPSDKTGNTVYLGTAAGGIWKTTDFLTTNPAGPTYVPLTLFGPNFSLNIGSIAAFGVNDDPSQTVLFAGTGFGQEATTANDGSPNVDLNSGRGVGILRSTDGGVTWTLLDSLVNTNPDGSELTEASRDHNFVGDTTYQILVDPKPELDGDIIVYAALGGPTGGLYQSLDSGNTWNMLKAGDCTSIILDPNSKSPTTGNLDTLYAAFSGQGPANSAQAGVYVSANQGQTLQLMVGQLGKDPLITGPGFPAQPIPVGNASVSPNSITGSYTVLAKPAITANTAENLGYQGWLYVAVENANGTFNGLYVTKDNGENWTLVQIPNIPGTGSVKAAVPTNDTSGASPSYDPTSDQFNQEGQYNLTLTVDPTNPNIVYIGGSQNFQASGMIRVDLTNLYDAHNFTSFSNDQTDGGLLNEAAQGGVTVTTPANGPAEYTGTMPPTPNYLSLRYAPTDPFNVNATLVVDNTSEFVNTGTGVTWTLFDEPLKANAGDTTGSTNVHNVIDYVDPLTGDVRMLIADDDGIFTALVNPDGTLDNGIGSDVEVNYSRNGNLQDEEILDSAAQPSFVSSQAAGALFYASGQTNLAAQSAADILTTGNLTWDNSTVLDASPTSPRTTAANTSINTSDRSGVGIATDPTGDTQSVYEFDIPILGGNLTDFFRINQFGQTTGLANNVNTEFPKQGSSGDAQVSGYVSSATSAVNNGQIPVGNFEVNPLNGDQILIGSATGNLYETTDDGSLFSPIGNAAEFQVNSTGDFTPIQFSAISYGAPDPNVKGGVGNLNNFIYVGTTGSALPDGSTPVVQSDGLFQNDGRIFVTQAGGKGWMNISSGLDGSSVVGIYPDPDRGSHAAYAVTLTGVFYSADTTGLAAAGQTVWTNITSNLTSIQHNPFGNAVYQEGVLAQFLGQNGQSTNSDVFTAQYGGFSSIVADYRYEIPAPTNATEGTNIFYPVLYVSGYGGVFRSIDNGVTWTVFPNTAFDAAPVDGGYLPSVDVTNLQLVLGDINPDTGHAVQATNDPEILLASTYGAGDYAIRLAPDVIPTSVVFDTTLPVPDGSDSSGDGSKITNVLEPYLDGVSEVSNFGDTVTINLYDESLNANGTPTAGFGTLLGTGTTNAIGQFVVQIVDSGQDSTFFTSSTALDDKIVGIRATDSSGASGNLTLFSYTLDTITPNTPATPVLESTYDTGRSSTDDLTNLSVPAQAGPGDPLTIVTPTFDISTPLPQANPLSPNPITLDVELLRSTSPNGPFFVINDTETGFINGAGTAEVYMLTDPTIAAMAEAGIDETFYYEALQIDEAGNVSQPASNVLSVTVNTIAPPAPTGITLVTESSTSPPMPVFSVTGVLPNDQVLLYRSIGGATPILVGSGAINTTNAPETLQVTDTIGATPDGVYTYYAVQQDVYGNYSPLSNGSSVVVTINTQTPPAAPILEAAYDTGRSNSDDVTNIAVPAPTPGVVPNFVAPVFDVNTVAPLVGQPAIATVQLFRANAPGGPYTMVGSIPFGGNPAMVTDATLQALVAQAYAAGTPIDQKFYYEADQINAAGITSAMSPDLPVLVDTVTPPTLPSPTLDKSSNTGLNTTLNITNQTHPIIDFTNLLPGEQAFLYRSFNGAAPILVGGYPAINTTSGPIGGMIQDQVGAVPDGVYLYYVVQQDLAGNISNFNTSAVQVTVNTTTPVKPTIALLASDDTGLPTHPNVTSDTLPAFIGTAQYSTPTNFPVAIINVATGAIIATAYPAANGTYQAQVTTALTKGVYTLEARTTNQAGTYSYSSTLTVTILPNSLGTGPSLMLSPATDTGIKGDGVTSNHQPQFIGSTSPNDGVTVSIYVLVNGVAQGPIATGTSSTVNGAFSIQLPNNLTDGTTQLEAVTSDIANNVSMPGPAYTVQIVTTDGDFAGTGKAQLTVFDPYTETYYVRGVGATTIPNAAGEDVPIEYDFNGDGKVDTVGYQYANAAYFGFLSNNSAINYAYGAANQSLPVSGYYGNSGTFLYGSYQPVTGTWEIALPQPGGLVLNFGVPKIDIPVPEAYNGFNSTELAVFRNTPIFGGDADSFSVIGPQGFYMVSFTSPAVAKLGFVYKPGDIAAPADYDGVGRDEFAVYRPSTGQFFILNTPSDTNTATWTLRTVTMNLPGGPNVNDEPASQDYDGDGKADPTVYRPSNSTFYMLQSTTGYQVNIPFGPAGQSVAAAGPILYRLNALLGTYASNGGYYGVITTAGGGGSGGLVSSIPGGGGGSFSAPSSGGNNSAVHIESVASAATSTTSASTSSSASSPLATMIAVSAPLPVTTTPAPAPVVSLTTAPSSVTVGASTPKTLVATSTASKETTKTSKAHPKKAAKTLTVDTKTIEAEAKAKAELAKAEAKAPAKAEVKITAKADSKTTESKSKASAVAKVTTALQHLVMALKGGKSKKG